jgi:hypothetical protein
MKKSADRDAIIAPTRILFVTTRGQSINQCENFMARKTDY